MRRIYKGKPGYETDFDAKLQEELVADIIGDHLFTDEDFIRQLAAEDKNLFQKIFDEVKHLVKMATPGSKEARQLEKLKHTFEKVYRETKTTAQQQDGVKYLLSKDINGDIFVDVTEDIFDATDGESIARTIQRVIAERFHNVIDVHGQKIQINKTTNDEFRRSNSSDGVRKYSSQAYTDKLKTIANADEILLAARNWIGEEIKHQRKDDIVEFARADVMYRVGENGYVADVLVGTRKNGAAVLYDIVNIYEKKITEASVTMVSNENSQRRQDASADPMLPQESQTVNSKMSLSEAAGGTAVTGNNVYGTDVALDPVEQDVQVEENSNTETNLPADSMAEVNTAQLERILGSKDSFVSQNAAALYEELRNLKKGVRASGQLSYLLDHFSKDEWGYIRTALLNIRDNPSETVNPNSRAEAVARELLDREYDDSLAELEEMRTAAQKPDEIRTARDRYMAKLYGYETERLENTEMRQQAAEAFEQQIVANNETQ